jgi:peroxin-12
LILVGMPYAKRRLDALHERLKEQYQFAPPPTVQPSILDRIQQLFFVHYPTINSILEFTQLILQCGYIFSRTSVHSPWLLFAGVKLMSWTPADHARFGQTEAPKWPSGQGFIAQLLWLFRAFPRVVAAAVSRLFGVGLFFIQFLEWWSQSEQRQEMNRSNTQRLPMPSAPHSKMVPLATNEAQAITLETHMCPICGKRRRNDTVLAVSGYVFCYSCIFRYITQEHRCPVTGAPAGKEHLVRLFINQVQI